MHISVVNRAPSVSMEEAQRVIRAINRQLREDFRPYWQKHARLRLEGDAGAGGNEHLIGELRGDAVLYLLDEVDENDALGYHDVNHRGIPHGFVFTKLSEELGEPWSVTLSHEAIELVGDPEVNLYAMGPHPTAPERSVLHWYELCDAVQSQTYEIDGVQVSNFLLPLYFTANEEFTGRHNDFLGARDAGGLRSFGVAPGGYLGFFDPATGKTETYTADEAASRRLTARRAAGSTRRTLLRQSDGPIAAASAGRRGRARFESISLGVTTDAKARLLLDGIVAHECKGWRVVRVDAAKQPEFDLFPPPGDGTDVNRAMQIVERIAASNNVRFADVSVLHPLPGMTDATPRPGRGALRASGAENETPLAGTEAPEWALALTRVHEAWQLCRARGVKPGEGVNVGHPDSGYRAHAELDRKSVV